ncbi:UBA protein [Geosmithia morbida]|uniref:UBA protein n=1 Tax=Geosmithia morbida TaxID=1094350 RepID=A0A9P4YRI9_9HYPO|nr:UBA protein [Geosmithia morbida]KAF4120760.1 UBA protein [Geosmithia morbida]
MNDLSGLDWSGGAGSKKPSMPPPPMSFPSLQPNPSPFSSNRSTPAPTQSSTIPPSHQQPTRSATAQDSFSNLAKFGPAKTNENLTLAQRQVQLEEEKRRKAEEQKRITEAQFGNGQFWDSLGSRGSPSPAAAAQNLPPPSSNDDDLFAAFNKDTQVDNASHFPPPTTSASQRSTPVNDPPLDLSDPSSWGGSARPSAAPSALDDDDPFGLNEMKPAASSPAPPPTQPTADDNDFDFMGDLNRPVDEVRRRQAASQPQPAPGKPIEGDDSSSDDDVPIQPQRQPQRQQAPPRPIQGRPPVKDAGFDRAVAQLVDYGFSAEDARRGLLESGAGTNVQAAANWLLDDAHRKSKAKAEGRDPSTVSAPPLRQAGSPANGEADFTHTAAAMGNTLFKTANSLWKTGQKRMQKAVAEFQQSEAGDPSQPRWLREAQMQQVAGSAAQASSNTTDEAMMLESGERPRPSRTSSRQQEKPHPSSSRPTSQTGSSRNSPVPRWQQQSAPPAMVDPKAKIDRMKADDDNFSTYSSPNRRRGQQTQTQPAPALGRQVEPEPDLLFNSQAPPAQPLPVRPAHQQQQQQPAKRPSAPRPSPPVQARPTRQIPPISPDALERSTRHRLEGTAHFKRGDYAAAHASYSSSLSAVPSTHPLAILLLTNRALTALKTGEPKQSVDSADQAIKLIGPGNGQGETVAVRGETGVDEIRDMRDLYGKALSRKAEALEQMEKWADAGVVWQQCVEAGLGGANAIKGRQRCQNATKPKAPTPAAAAAAPRRAPARPKPSTAASLTPPQSSKAVTRLREANEAAVKEEMERVAMTDAVDAKVSSWRDGKRDNLRALLGSLDQVLWAESGWKKISMADLVMPNKVKINYMKAIAKTHPDKLPQDANTEVRMIAGLVFSTLNESWDKFKAENGL